MSGGYHTVKGSPFDKAEAAMYEFCHNLYLSRAVSECVQSLLQAEKEYDEAKLQEDAQKMKQKKLEMQTYQASLTLTAYMYDDAEDIST